ncbi:MAG TPA: DUF2071 domain-containing protein, partial [Saprospiraceae bacterium]|nr:DUF2071 domain-containing protein [Saprospiraceae bacterium]
EEVNLRFYVYREEEGKRKRGVVFIRELVPKPAVTFVANKIYHEHYQTAAMRHQWELQDDLWQITYQWKKSAWQTLHIESRNTPFPLVEGSKEEFFTEHYWGYTQRKPDQTLEYFVDHHPWQLYPTVSYNVEVDFEENYGKSFRFLNEQVPDTIFLAEGSDIALQKSKVIR